jgi:hypothetical protein
VPGEEEPKQRNCGNNKLFDLEWVVTEKEIHS